MSDKIRIGIVGYGNLGKGVETALTQNADMELVGVFTRRDPANMQLHNAATPLHHFNSLANMQDHIDVLILCLGSATDLPQLTPQLARSFTVVDSFDTHAKMSEHFENVDEAARAGGTIALIAIGWDPGLFSLNRLLARAILPSGTDYTFWGKGISQGHSDAVRRIDGVADARQYTIPVDAALDAVRSGKTPELSTREKHIRLVYVVAKNTADQKRIEKEIVSMPHYFDEYDTTVHFVSAEELAKNHTGLPHGGSVFRSGKTGFENEHTQITEFRLQLESNPEFTASVLVAYARAAHRLTQEGQYGCRTIFDIAPACLVNMSAEEMRANLL